MKIGINLVGVFEHVDEKDHTGYNTGKQRDWKLQKECLLSQIINCWEDHDITLYITTYNFPEINDMISFYNPRKVKILEYEKSHMQLTYKESLQQLMGEDLDFIICVRPDLFLFKKLNEYPINFNKFNFFHKQGSLWEDETEYGDYETALVNWRHHIWPTYHLVNDTLFALPYNMLPVFISAIENHYEDEHMPGKVHATLHNIWIFLRKYLHSDDINWLISDVQQFINADIEMAMKNFEEMRYESKEYFMCRQADYHNETYNLEKDWKQFVIFMKKRLNII